ncbi:hypothetical protein ACFLYG_03145 [Chloroflexota bacterium]
MTCTRRLAIIVILMGMVGIVMGGVFIGLGVSRNNELKEAMRVEHIALGIEAAETKDKVIDSLGEAKNAGDVIREHRRGIAPTYSDLLGGGRYDPADPIQLTYAQALNLENYLYLAVVAFGLVQSVIANGFFMIVMGVALGGVGLALLGLARTSY